MTVSKAVESVEIICSTQKKRRWTAYEKHNIVQETYHPGVTVSYIARKHVIPPSQLFSWRKFMEKGALAGVKSEDEVVPQSEIMNLKNV